MTRYLSISVIVSSLAVTGAFGASSRGDLPRVLERVGRRVEQSWQEFSDVTCLESVLQTKLTPAGKMLLEKKSEYDYLVLMQLTDGELNIDESRLEKRVSATKSDRPLLATAGFSTLLLIFHPHFQSSFEFSDDSDSLNGAGAASNGLYAIHFQHRQGGRSPSVLQLRKRMYPIEWRGTAWVDPLTGTIAKIHTELSGPMADVGLQTLSSDVNYEPVTLNGQRYLLPNTAVIDAQTQRQRWHNVHRFQNYRLFSVDAQSQTGPAATAAPGGNPEPTTAPAEPPKKKGKQKK